MLAPGDFITWNNLGVLETGANGPRMRSPFFRRSLELNPNFADARRNLDATERQLERARSAGG